MKLNLLWLAGMILLSLPACEQQPQQLTQKQIVVKKPVAKTSQKAIAVNHDTICIAAVGDIMLGTAYPNGNQLPPDSAKGSFAHCLKELREADLTFGNLEGTLADQGAPAWYKRNKKLTFLFRMPVSYGAVLKDAGFDVMSVANNHIGDFADSGRASTIRTLTNNGIKFAGLLSYPTTILQINRLKFGFCAFAPNANTVPILDLKNQTRIISNLKQQCDVVIVSFHGGAEGATFEHVPFKMESYCGEKRGDVYTFAHSAIDAGADLVLGNGPHVSRAMENYKGRLIAYSLGNFCTYKSVSVSGVCGMAPLLKVYINKKGEFLKGRIIAFRQTHQDGLVRDTLNRVVRRIRTLTETDFPASGLTIGDDGMILPGS